MGRKLYVGNLNWNTTEDALRQAFAAIGTVSEVAIILDRETGRPRGFAFVTMSTDDEARAAAENMDGTLLDGRPLRVNEAQDRRPGGGDFGNRPRPDARPDARPGGGGFRSGPPRSDFRGGAGPGAGSAVPAGGGGIDSSSRPPREFRDEAPRPDAGWSDGGGRGGFGGGRGGGASKERGRGGKPGRGRDDEWRGGGGRRGGGDGGGWDEDSD